MDVGFATSNFYSAKEIMVIPNVPVFLTESDKLDYRISIEGKTGLNLSGRIYIIRKSFVQIRAKRAACLVPKSTLSEYKGFWQWGHYKNVRDECTLFMFNTLPDGVIKLEENFHVSYTGYFNCSIITVECLYAPEYRSNTDGSKITVQK